MSDELFSGILMLVGLALLIGGGELLVRGASALAAAFQISPLVIGLTVVAFGTSAPELAVSIQSAFAGSADLALGNVLGSNIFNVLFILGISAMIMPLTVSSELIRRDVPLMIGVSILLLLLGLDGSIGRIDGAVLTCGIIGYTGWCIRQSRRESKEIQAEFAAVAPPANPQSWSVVRQLALILAGLCLLGLGSRWLVDGAVNIAAGLGVSQLVIGLTIVAAGTSLPEVVTSIVAALRGERDIAVGNVVGSNIFNILCVLGVSSTIAPQGIAVSPAALRFDIPIVIAVAVACLPIFITGKVIARWEGGLFFFYYLMYTTYLVLDATQNEFHRTFGAVMLVFVVPLTVLTLAVSVARNRGR